MEKYTVIGGKTLSGKTTASGAKNVALKALVASCLTGETVTIENVPLISDLYIMLEIIKNLGGNVTLTDHTVKVTMGTFTSRQIPLDAAAEVRTSSMFIAPLLAREGEALIPNPGGCRLGARPIDRTIEGLQKMNAVITYDSEDGFFHAKTRGLRGTTYRFEKNSHTATETMILAGVLAKGTTVLKNAAEEPEVDELIDLLDAMGGKIRRTSAREITIDGVETLHAGSMRVKPDRNEVVTLAAAAVVTKGDILIEEAEKGPIKAFLEKFSEAGGGFEEQQGGLRFFYKGPLHAVSVETSPHPGFMTDWQGPWTLLMTQADGESVVHERVFENRLGYVGELRKMGAKIDLFNPQITDPKAIYNFNLSDDRPGFFHAAKVYGPVKLHNAVVTMSDIRAGATLVLSALAATGESTILGVEKLDRGYEQLEVRLRGLGADITRLQI